jgi:hypothetical protein
LPEEFKGQWEPLPTQFGMNSPPNSKKPAATEKTKGVSLENMMLYDWFKYAMEKPETAYPMIFPSNLAGPDTCMGFRNKNDPKKIMFVLVQTKLAMKVKCQDAIATVNPWLFFYKNRTAKVKADDVENQKFETKKAAEAAKLTGALKSEEETVTNFPALKTNEIKSARERTPMSGGKADNAVENQDETNAVASASGTTGTNAPKEVTPKNVGKAEPINSDYEAKNKELSNLLTQHKAVVVRVLFSGVGGEVKETRVGKGGKAFGIPKAMLLDNGRGGKDLQLIICPGDKEGDDLGNLEIVLGNLYTEVQGLKDVEDDKE